MSARFEIGGRYPDRYGIVHEVAARSAKFVTLDDGTRYKVRNWSGSSDRAEGTEYVILGSYSMAPAIWSDKVEDGTEAETRWYWMVTS